MMAWLRRLFRRPRRYDPAADETVRYLRERRAAALASTRAARRGPPSWEGLMGAGERRR